MMQQIRNILSLMIGLYWSLPSIAQSKIDQQQFISYTPEGFIKTEKTIASNGDTLFTHYNYVTDVLISTGGVLCGSPTEDLQGYANILSKNMVEAVVEKFVSVKSPNDNTERVTGGQLTTFYSNKPYPKAIYGLEITAPITSIFSPCVYSASICGISYNAAYKLQSTFDKYDSYGYLLQMTAKGGQSTVYIYGYKGAYRMATIKNAKIDQVAYSSFENLDDSGNWLYSASSISNDAITGKKCFNLSISNVSSDVLPDGQYIVSFWQKNGSVNVTGLLSVTGDVANGWQYQEYQVTINSAAGNNHIVIGGTGLIDELRLYPINAQMETSTYEPLKGVNSTCDNKNQIVSYEYDQLGRILIVRDQFGNITKKMDYGIQATE
jgi:YD repeat-containing protein